MKLFYGPTSPYVRKVLVLAHECGVFHRLEFVSPDGSDPAGRIRAHNPLGKVPTLVLDDATAILDSPVICEYLDALHHRRRLVPRRGDSRFAAASLHALGDGMMDASVLRIQELRREPELRSARWIAHQAVAIDHAAAFLERDPGRLRGPLHVGHIAIACALGHVEFRHPDIAWRGSAPALERWFDDFARRPSMIATAPADATCGRS